MSFISHKLQLKAVKVYIGILVHSIQWLFTVSHKHRTPPQSCDARQGSSSSKYGPKDTGERPNCRKARCMVLFLILFILVCFIAMQDKCGLLPPLDTSDRTDVFGFWVGADSRLLMDCSPPLRFVSPCSACSLRGDWLQRWVHSNQDNKWKKKESRSKWQNVFCTWNMVWRRAVVRLVTKNPHVNRR